MIREQLNNNRVEALDKIRDIYSKYSGKEIADAAGITASHLSNIVSWVRTTPYETLMVILEAAKKVKKKHSVK